MVRQFFLILNAVLAAWTALLVEGGTPPQSDRQTLMHILTVYTDAISLRNISAIPVASNVRVTDNGQVTSLGNGTVWRAPGLLRIPYRHALVDTDTGAATLRATISNQTVPINSTAAEIANPPPGQWYFYVLRLKIVGGLITEVEEIASSVALVPGVSASMLDMPDRIWDALIPENQRMTPQALQQAANAYWDTVAGTLPWPQAPFHPECNRIENGGQTTNSVFGPLTCGTEFTSPALMGYTITNRRIYVTDPYAGVIAGIADFNAGQGPASVSTIFEVFKVQDGLLRHIEAFFDAQGQLHSGWGS
jgi:hypothetical protein